MQDKKKYCQKMSYLVFLSCFPVWHHFENFLEKKNFSLVYKNELSLCLKLQPISANGVKKSNLIQREDFTFLTLFVFIFLFKV